MGLDFTKPAASPAPADQNTATPAVQEETYPQYNIVADRQQMDQTLTGSQEVDELASKIEVYHLETIVSFGAEAADEISKCSDVVLNSWTTPASCSTPWPRSWTSSTSRS